MKFPKSIDRKVRLPRLWSNNELGKIASLFRGDVVNVSAWKDSDKDGKNYEEYFVNAKNYWITNHQTREKGFDPKLKNQISLDLELPLPKNLKGRFDVVFNHTTLEHVFECKTAFSNLCQMTSDVVILVVPFIQHQHAAYGDYWRFTPDCINELFSKNDMKLVYISFNDGPNQAVYIFAIGTKEPKKWKKHLKSILITKFHLLKKRLALRLLINHCFTS